MSAVSICKSFVLLLLIVCQGPLSAAQATNVSVGTWKTAQTIQPFFYEQFLSAEWNVQIHTFTNPADQKTALLAGSLEMTGTTLAHAIRSAAQGQPIVIVAALCNKCSALVVSSNSNIHSEKDLKGKKIGYVPGTMHEILLRETLMRNGLSPEKDVTLIRVDFFDMGTALARGSIDAFLSGEPFPALAVQRGYGEILSYPYYGDSIGAINAVMIVRRETIEKQPEIVEQLVLAHAKATKMLVIDQETWFAKATNFGIQPETLELSATNMELSWQMDETFVAQTKALGAQMEKLGMIAKQPDYNKLFDLNFVNQAQQRLK
ncbi:NitT/TauT family transport system substrate-binding protein [Desulfuromusa kysingii]|uniref:NitT/TauT family transport system substrate-binding protein n=1 Tax=Desulfuromusa kysingii TaxID=37625 RepID=A0A1H4A0C9_9BACT|nr:ABC transporter substrate-binding protein [Desulfuromusa kysingii]SEA29529.1 NitT/TauT family transport system substrate-binding protein [Desulfuromusa kysingii]